MSSNDIDIALSSMMGFPFALEFSAFLQSKGIPITRVTKVESRADQSKHLETAKLSALGLDLDFVNLRSEVYAENSRVPVKVVRINRVYVLQLSIRSQNKRLGIRYETRRHPPERYYN